MKLYILINSNPEGNNFRGVYDTKEAAEAEAKAWNDQEKRENRLMYRDESIFKTKEALDKHIEIMCEWDKVEVIEYELNTSNRPKPRYNPDGSYIE